MSCIHINVADDDIRRLEAAGLLGPDLQAIHGNLISDAELRAMARILMPLCFTPSAERAGRAGRRRAACAPGGRADLFWLTCPVR